MTPAEEMRAAAKSLRERAAEITQGRWEYQEGPPASEVVAEEGGWIIARSTHVEDDDFRWIALMGPNVAPGIAALLEHYAESVAWSDNWDDIRNCGVPMKRFAYAILGRQE